MAKKKQSRSQDPKQHSQPQPQPMATDDPSVQIQNLKNLNSVLLKETTHHRQHIQSLQSALHRSAMVHDINLALHLEKTVLLAFLDSHVQETSLRFHTLVGDKNDKDHEVSLLKREVNDLTARLENENDELTVLTQERDLLKAEFLAESKRLEETVNREKKLLEEAVKLKLEGESLLEQVSEKERIIGELKNDKDLAVKSSQEDVEKLKEEVDAVTREKDEIQKLNIAQNMKVATLEHDLNQLNESLKNSRNEEEFMRAKILHLEQNLGLALQKEEDMAMEISALLRDKKETEKSVEVLTEKNDSVEKVLDLVQKELEDKQHELDEAIRVRGEVENVKVNCENEILEYRREVDRLKGVVEKLKESCREFEEENKQLISQVNHYKNAVDEAVLEKDNMRKKFDEERKEAQKLLLESKCLMKSEEEKFVEKCMKLEKHVDALMKEKIALQGSLLEAQRESDDLRAKIEFWSTNSDKALTLLKSTAAVVCQYKDGGEEVRPNEKIVEEIQSYAEELDAIEEAFKSKNEMVDDMKLQLVSMQKSVAEAHKSKSLWTVISSATTIFATVLAAYFARVR